MTRFSVSKLKSHIDHIRTIKNEEWLNSLNDRKTKELEFHNKDRDRKAIAQLDQDTFEKFYGNKKYYNTTFRSRKYVENWIQKHAKGKVFLDYACGNGANAIFAAQNGASLSLGLDISDVSVQNAEADAKKLQLEDNTCFFQADAENTKLPDNSVDAIICSGMLHHLDLSYAFYELRRILAPGGVILAVEALDYNPFIKLYRQITPDMRTEWEKAHILSLKDLRFASYFFDVKNVKYWHIIGYAAALIPALGKAFDLFDRLAEKIPFLNRLSWMFTFELHKKPSNDTIKEQAQD